jgi:hypothetical protein
MPSHQALLMTLDSIELIKDEGTLQDQQQPDHRGQGPERVERMHEGPDRSAEEQDAQQAVRPPPAPPHRSDQEFVHHRGQEDHPDQDPDGGDRRHPEPQHDHRNDKPRDPGQQQHPPGAPQPPPVGPDPGTAHPVILPRLLIDAHPIPPELN